MLDILLPQIQHLSSDANVHIQKSHPTNTSDQKLSSLHWRIDLMDIDWSWDFIKLGILAVRTFFLLNRKGWSEYLKDVADVKNQKSRKFK